MPWIIAQKIDWFWVYDNTIASAEPNEIPLFTGLYHCQRLIRDHLLPSGLTTFALTLMTMKLIVEL
jgi:hypothetical protein